MPTSDWSPQAIAARIDEALAETSELDPRTKKIGPISQGELERRVGIAKPGARGPAYINKLRKGERGTSSLKIEWMVRLSQVLNVEMLWLFAGLGTKRRAPGDPPAHGRDLGLYMAALAGRPSDVIDQVRAELAGPEHENEDPATVLGLVDARASMQRNKMSASAAHAKLGREQGAKIEREKKKAEKATKKASRIAQKKAPREEQSKPSSRRLVVGDDD